MALPESQGLQAATPSPLERLWGLWIWQWRRGGEKREKDKERSLGCASRHFFFSTLSTD